MRYPILQFYSKCKMATKKIRFDILKLNKILRYARKYNGMTLNDLSELSGVSAGYLGEIERGRLPTLETLNKIGQVYNVTFGLTLIVDDEE